MAKYSMVVMTNCEPGTDAEFNDWYDRIHLPDVLRVPGIVAAQRYKLTAEQRRTTHPGWGYLAIYEVETRNLKATYEVMDRELPKAYKSPSMNKTTWAYFFQPIGKRQVKAGSKPAAKKRAGVKTAAKSAVTKRVKRPAKGAAKRGAGRTAGKGK